MRRLLRSSRARWYLLAAMWTVVLVLGIGGFLQQSAESGEPRSFLDQLYLTLQLATLDYDGSSGPMNWRLEICRFVVPLMAAGTVLQAASVVFLEEFNRFRIGRSSNHTVVAGLGDVGRRLAHSFADAGDRVVAIDPDPARVRAVTESDDRVDGLVGDPSEAATLQRVRVERARRLVVAAGADALNVAVASTAAEVSAAGRRSRAALRVAVQLSDAELAAGLRAADLDATGSVRLSYFSLHERAARALLSEHPPFGRLPKHARDGGGGPRPMVIGMGQFGRSLVVAMGLQWTHQHPGRRLPITIVDAHAHGRWAELALRHPGLADIAVPTVVEVDLTVPTGPGIEDFRAVLEKEPPTWVAIVVDDEPLALANAVFLHHRLPRGSVPIIVRMGSGAGLGTLLNPVSGSEQTFPGVSVFPLLDRSCTVESVEGGIREQLAEAVHEDYLATVADRVAAGSLARPWQELDDDQRDLSRRRVDGILGDLDSVGCDLVPLRRWGSAEAPFTESEVQTLAEREHSRWLADRTASGWTYGEVRDDVAKRNPLLVPWDQLGDEARAANVDSTRELPGMLARAGFEVVRR